MKGISQLEERNLSVLGYLSKLRINVFSQLVLVRHERTADLVGDFVLLLFRFRAFAPIHSLGHIKKRGQCENLYR